MGFRPYIAEKASVDIAIYAGGVDVMQTGSVWCIEFTIVEDNSQECCPILASRVHADRAAFVDRKTHVP